MKKSENFTFKKPRKIAFGNKEFKIIYKNKKFFAGHRGECTDPDSNVREIRISPEAWDSSKSLLETVIDEIFHAKFFFIENSEVDEFSDNLADFLWEMGWRLPDKKEKK